MKQLLQFVLFFLFGIFLIIGFVLGASVGYANSSHDTPVQQPVSTPTRVDTAPNGQHNLLFILVDDLEAPTPQLEAVWMVLSLPPNPQITLLPLFPASSDKPLLDGSRLASTFSITSTGEPTPEFLQVLNEQGLWWMNWMVIDRSGLTQAIDLSGGLDLGNGPIPANDVVSKLTPPSESPATALEGQTLLFRGLCQQPVTEAQFNILIRRLDKLAPHLLSDLEKDQIAAAWRPFLRSGNNKLSCEFPTVR